MVNETIPAHFLCLSIKRVLDWVPQITMLQFTYKRKEVAFMKKCCDTPPFIF